MSDEHHDENEDSIVKGDRRRRGGSRSSRRVTLPSEQPRLFGREVQSRHDRRRPERRPCRSRLSLRPRRARPLWRPIKHRQGMVAQAYEARFRRSLTERTRFAGPLS